MDLNKLLASATREVIKNIVQDEELFYAKYSFRMALLQSHLGLDVFKQVGLANCDGSTDRVPGLPRRRNDLCQRSHQAVQTAAHAAPTRACRTVGSLLDRAPRPVHSRIQSICREAHVGRAHQVRLHAGHGLPARVPRTHARPEASGPQCRLPLLIGLETEEPSDHSQAGASRARAAARAN